MSAELMARAQAGDVDAFAELYALHRRAVLTYCWKRHPGRAEELTQDVFVKALANLHRWRDTGRDPGAWLTTIAANLCRDRAKSADYRLNEPVGEVPEYLRDFQQWRYDPAALLVEDLTRREVLLALLELTDPQRQAVVLFYLRDMSLAEAAEVMGSNPDAVKLLLFRARREMARLLRQAGAHVQ